MDSWIFIDDDPQKEALTLYGGVESKSDGRQVRSKAGGLDTRAQLRLYPERRWVRELQENRKSGPSRV